jgi:cysteine desulfurase
VSNIYFDNAATTKIDQSVINLMNNVMTNNYGNPNSTHSFGRSSRTLVEKARKSIAKEFNVLPSEIFFTSCGTESDNLILISAVKDLGVKRIVTSEIEHKAVLNVVKFLKLTESIKVEFVKVNRKGLIDYKDLNKVLVKTNLKTIVSLMHVNNEIDSIEIKHTAHNRKGFALGAVIAAEWILNKKGVFNMSDVIKDSNFKF